ncbi:helix-turn-helix domain-containing protein [Anaerotignum propionicum]|uniref:DNA-binding domain-containing protein n=1 Tax=Anaerotignum propionicum DSM 1682 TaxID=991789 RepID=A0A0X1U918_ANAPI|nr:ATP-binding protein [Anaerotignum propionicum]AMJ41419.1 divergent AAA domain protein [Anaerotignum propionicum DSM 1682]SHE67948.1 Putative DNA-binding domain-containing protein [[Clostridium] propionicum DSM 1682] [Anaerotignum propionicum DSM 1682]
MNIQDLTEQVANLISLKQEGDHWDFKREWYINKADLLHDIICMANNLSSQDGLIIIGIDEERDYEIQEMVDDSNQKKTQDLVSFLRDKRFAGGIRPTVTVQSILLSEKSIDVIVIHSDRNTPYYLTEQYQGVYANNIYVRIMDTNTPKNSSADINIIETLWKKRFGIDATALERVILYLQSPSDWVDSADESRRYYKYAPEFVIEQISAADDRDGYEFYLFGQYDSRPHWYDINLYYHQTLLDSLGGAALDGGRYFTATPKIEGLSLDGNRMDWDISYKYLIKESIEYIVHKFYITDDMDEEQTSRRRFLECILIFESEIEKVRFDKFVKENYANYNADDFEGMLPHFPNIEGYVMSAFKKDYLNALILKKMLDDFRATF